MSLGSMNAQQNPSHGLTDTPVVNFPHDKVIVFVSSGLSIATLLALKP